MEHRCMRCGRKIREDGIGNRIKTVGKEKGWHWFFRHVKQLISLVRHGFVKPETENFIELCDMCFSDWTSILALWMQTSQKNVLKKLGQRGLYHV